jgi:hypothetical protein
MPPADRFHTGLGLAPDFRIADRVNELMSVPTQTCKDELRHALTDGAAMNPASINSSNAWWLCRGRNPLSRKLIGPIDTDRVASLGGHLLRLEQQFAPTPCHASFHRAPPTPGPACRGALMRLTFGASKPIDFMG